MGTSTTTTSFKQKIFLNTKQREQLIISTKARVMLIDAVVYSRPGLHETGTKSDRIEIVGVFTLFCVYAWDFAKLCMCFVKRQTGLRKRSDKETPVPVNIRTGLKIVISVQNRNDFEPPSEHFPASWKQLYNRQHYIKTNSCACRSNFVPVSGIKYSANLLYLHHNVNSPRDEGCS